MNKYDELDKLIVRVTKFSKTLICDSSELDKDKYDCIKTKIFELKQEIERLRNEESNI